MQCTVRTCCSPFNIVTRYILQFGDGHASVQVDALYLSNEITNSATGVWALSIILYLQTIFKTIYRLQAQVAAVYRRRNVAKTHIIAKCSGLTNEKQPFYYNVYSSVTETKNKLNIKLQVWFSVFDSRLPILSAMPHWLKTRPQHLQKCKFLSMVLTLLSRSRVSSWIAGRVPVWYYNRHRKSS